MAKKNLKLFAQAKKYLVGGVDSPVRSFKSTGTAPLLIKKGKGAKIYDYDEKSYIDYVLSFGALILGHSHLAVIKAVKKAINSGFSFSTTNRTEIELAKTIIQAVPFIEQIRFVNSGTEAVMGALRLARGYTARDKILKFSHSFHGSADYLLVQAGSGLATLNIATSAGVPKDFIKHTLIAPYGDSKTVEKIFKKYGSQIAAVIVEPAGGNYGVISPEINFLKSLRKITREYNALLVFDEVITGFRFHFGTAAQKLGITPDIICLGKIIGGGLPIGAFGAKSKIMRHLAPLGKVYQASTFSGNPVVMQAGLSTLKILKELDYEQPKKLTEFLVGRLKKEVAYGKVNLTISHYANMFSLQFKNNQQFRSFYKFMLEQGVYFAPSEFEANFISFAHSKKDIEKTLDAARRFFL